MRRFSSFVEFLFYIASGLILSIRHCFRIHDLVECFSADVSKVQCCASQVRSLFVCVLRNCARFVIANHLGERGDQHQGLFHIALDARAIGFHSLNHGHPKTVAGIGEQGDGLQQVEADQRFVHIHLQMSSRTGHGHRSIQADHLGADHGHRFALGGVHLARHD